MHRLGTPIGDMNAVRKHLSRVKGGRLAEAFRGRLLVSLIVSDVVGDPLDVIASGPTAPDPTTFADALRILDAYRITGTAIPDILRHLERGAQGLVSETPKELPPHVHNLIVGKNLNAISASAAVANRLGYRVLNLGSFIEGEAREVGIVAAGLVRGIREHGLPLPAPACVLLGGETTVTLCCDWGRGGRNQEFVLAAAAKLGAGGMAGVCVLSGGTDGEDGPTDAAGAVATADMLRRAAELGLDPRAFLDRHDS
jgi:glycerate-2-kinase